MMAGSSALRMAGLLDSQAEQWAAWMAEHWGAWSVGCLRVETADCSTADCWTDVMSVASTVGW
jgi:hypothetical protein